MPHPDTIGDYFGLVLESHLKAAIQKKLDETSSFKKSLAGIHTADDARNKGYAPSHAQVDEMKASIGKHANAKYAHAHFRALPAKQAAKDMVDEVAKDMAVLNQQWQKNRQFYFDRSALADLTKEAVELVAAEHENAKKRFA